MPSEKFSSFLFKATFFYPAAHQKKGVG